MKKKTIIIAFLSALVLAGTTVVAVFALDKGISSEVATPDKAAVLVKDDPSVKVDVPKTYMEAGISFDYSEDQINAMVEQEKVRSVLSEVVAETPGLEKIYMDEYECMDMTRDQIKRYGELLVKVGAESKNMMNDYPRVRAQAMGELPLDAPRLTVDVLNEIIGQSASKDEMWEKIREQHVISDESLQFSGYPGSKSRYWLDDEGSEQIVFTSRWNEMEISLYNAESDTSELLYSEEDLTNLFAAETAE